METEKENKENNESKYDKAFQIVLVVLIMATACFIAAGNRIREASGQSVLSEPKRFCVVIDAGHGGKDPGKVGVDGSLEKDINLAIACKLKVFLEEADVRVVMTRESDEGLNDASASNKKVQDMRRRVSIIEETKPDLTVSIHQNSYHEEYVHGAQTFYYSSGDQSRKLAEFIQQAIVERLDEKNQRKAKANTSYYLLKKTSSPIVIAECGFLSNREETQKLSSDLYQERMAFAIHMGIMRYLNSQK